MTEATALLVVARTRELSSPTDVLLELYNSEGGKVAENDDVGLRDAELTFMLPAAGDYFLKVGEMLVEVVQSGSMPGRNPRTKSR